MATAARRAGTRLITGVEELDRRLAQLKIGAANKIARPALLKGARLLLRKMKNAVPPDKTYIKRALGIVVNAKGGEQRAKVGAAVGKAAKVAPKRSGDNRGGVGISGRNIHWALLGTAKRAKKSTGASTGAMPPQVPGLVRGVAASSDAQVKAAIAQEGRERLARLARK